MAVSSEDDIPTQLAALLGKETVQIRKTDEKPPRVSIIDVTMAVSGGSQHDAARTLRRLSDQYPEVGPNWPHLKFKGRGQRDTPVTDAKGIVEIIMLLQGKQAARVRRLAAELLCRYLGGDLALVDEVCRVRGFQEEMAAHRPEDPRRIFGEAVEATGGTAGSALTTQLARACTEAIANAVPGVLERLSAHIDERLAQDRQRVNLNVRAPKRAAPYDPPIARDIAGAGRPLPLARFLDGKEIADPSWRGVRKSLMPFFGMQMQILKKKRLRNGGAEAIMWNRIIVPSSCTPRTTASSWSRRGR